METSVTCLPPVRSEFYQTVISAMLAHDAPDADQADRPIWRADDIVSRMGLLTETEQAIVAHQASLMRNPLKTRKIYLSIVRHFFKLAQVAISDVRPHHIEEWLTHLTRKRLKVTTVKHRLSVIKAFFGYLHKTGLMRINPSMPVKGPRYVPHYYGDKVLTREELDTLIDHMRHKAQMRDFMLCRVMASCGLRVAECLSLTWGDLAQDVRGRWFAKIVGKGGKRHHVYVPKDVMRDVMQWRQEAFGVPCLVEAPALDWLPIFARRWKVSEAVSTVTAYKVIRQHAQEALGKRISPHWLRHTFATHARLLGATIEQIRDQLGHESIQTTMRYEHSPHLMEPAGAVFERGLS